MYSLTVQLGPFDNKDSAEAYVEAYRKYSGLFIAGKIEKIYGRGEHDEESE